MNAHDDRRSTNRRSFLRLLAMLGVGVQAFARSGSVMGAISEARASIEEDWPAMPRRRLGRTNFDASRLIFGCGAALSRGQAVSLLDVAFDAGVNVFDVGYRDYYDDAEKNLAPFLKRTRDRVFLISKAGFISLEPDDEVSLAQAKEGAKEWLKQMDQSLSELQVDHVDAYYLMAVNNPAIVRSDEMYEAFLKAKRAGKVSFFGLSTHQNAQNVLQAAMETDRYD
ncbi:MAG: aldo/keto reductase, partial [Pseudomonadales bacterium]